jgi:hypothetical protein
MGTSHISFLTCTVMDVAWNGGLPQHTICTTLYHLTHGQGRASMVQMSFTSERRAMLVPMSAGGRISGGLLSATWRALTLDQQVAQVGAPAWGTVWNPLAWTNCS